MYQVSRSILWSYCKKYIGSQLYEWSLIRYSAVPSRSVLQLRIYWLSLLISYISKTYYVVQAFDKIHDHTYIFRFKKDKKTGYKIYLYYQIHVHITFWLFRTYKVRCTTKVLDKGRFLSMHSRNIKQTVYIVLLYRFLVLCDNNNNT